MGESVWTWGEHREEKKILLLNGSPRKTKSATYRVANAFLRGLTSLYPCAVEVVHISDLTIRPCLGCLSCWGRTEGRCVITDDDIPALKEKILSSDIVIQAMPLYFFGMPGTVKVMCDRLLSMLSTYRGQTPVAGQPFHGLRYPNEHRRFLLVSTCGYAQTDLIYDALLSEYDCICGAGNYQAILCPQGKVYTIPELHDRMETFLEKFADAGREFAAHGVLSNETLKELSVPPFNERRFRLLLNKFWADEAAKGGRGNV